MNIQHFQVVDLFAGPGGLGEGFSQFATSKGERPFTLSLSIEKDPFAAMTLKWRAFTRAMYAAGVEPERLVEALLRLPNSSAPNPQTAALLDLGSTWRACAVDAANHSDLEAWNFELGHAGRGAVLQRLATLDRTRPVVLIGGPPCQAYSLVGRVRNRGKADYVAREDHRHFLYREYLHVLRNVEPDVFVMENVKGILSAQVDQIDIFSSIVADLSDPTKAIDGTSGGAQYKIYSLPTGSELASPRDAIVRMEQWGIPQKRHRVMLLGVRADLASTLRDGVASLARERSGVEQYSVKNALAGLPPLRSGLSKEPDGQSAWEQAVASFENASWRRTLPDANRGSFHPSAVAINSLGRGREVAVCGRQTEGPCHRNWFDAHPTGYVLNHVTRGHMRSDLERYFFAATYASLVGSAPGLRDFPAELLPQHANVRDEMTPIFSDRFKVQVWDSPASTVTSHISKDGNYFIHPDPTQCRSLTVREAARLQTFPDDYFFCGPRTEQFRQVGNAVPPLMANLVAKVVHKVINRE